MIHLWAPDLIFLPALPWVPCAEVPVAVNHQILFSHYSENNYGLVSVQRIVAFFMSLISFHKKPWIPHAEARGYLLSLTTY